MLQINVMFSYVNLVFTQESIYALHVIKMFVNAKEDEIGRRRM